MNGFSRSVQAVLGLLTLALIVVVVVFAVSGDDEDPAPPAGTTAEETAEPGAESEGQDGMDGAAQADSKAATLFADTCGSCHTLTIAGTTGNVGPALDDYSYDRRRVLDTIQEGPGQMPAGLLQGKDAEAVADLIASDQPSAGDPSEPTDDDGPPDS